MKVFFLALTLGLSGVADGAIYGSGNLHEPYEEPVAKIQKISRSTGALVNVAELQRRDDGFAIIGGTFGENFNMCTSENYLAQPNAAYCSAVLVAADVALTAGHCMDAQSVCDQTSMVFDYTMKPNGEPIAKLKSSQVYQCAEVLYTTAGSSHPIDNVDFALIRLARPVSDRKPVRFKNAKINANDELFIIGHPLGLPTKIAKEGRLRRITKHSIQMSISAFDHNSGSPIFDLKSQRLQGIYHTSFVRDLTPNGSCNQFAHYDMSYGPGEFGMRIEIAQKKLKELGY